MENKITIEPHGNGYAIYVDRDQNHHGANVALISEIDPNYPIINVLKVALEIAALPNHPQPQPSGPKRQEDEFKPGDKVRRIGNLSGGVVVGTRRTDPLSVLVQWRHSPIREWCNPDDLILDPHPYLENEVWSKSTMDRLKEPHEKCTFNSPIPAQPDVNPVSSTLQPGDRVALAILDGDSDVFSGGPETGIVISNKALVCWDKQGPIDLLDHRDLRKVQR